MKFIKNISLVLLVGAAMWNCESYNKTMVEVPVIKPAVFTSYPTASVVLDKDQPTLSQVTMAWSPAKYGYSAAVTYTLQASLVDNDVVDAQKVKWVEVGQTNLLSLSLQNKVLCTALVEGLKAAPLKAAQVNIRLFSSIGDNTYDTVSLPVTLVITPFTLKAAELFFKGEFNGGNQKAGPMLYSELSNEIYKGWAYMNVAGKAQGDLIGFKFSSEDSDDGINYGRSLNPLDPDSAAPDIEIENGYCYLFTVDIPQLLATIDKKFTRVSIIGDATPNGWSDTELTYDPVAKVFKVTGLVMKAGKFKFRADNAWDLNWGLDKNLKPGQLPLAGGGDDITFSLDAGTYTVALDLFKLVPTYTFTKE